jgi:hypothetical protein
MKSENWGGRRVLVSGFFDAMSGVLPYPAQMDEDGPREGWAALACDAVSHYLGCSNDALQQWRVSHVIVQSGLD